MDRVHLLNVGVGDCTIIEHQSSRVSIIDICSGNSESERLGMNLTTAISIPQTVSAPPIGSYQGGMRSAISNRSGNYAMKARQTNPVDYLTDKLKKDSIFRFILTHPDMDHMDGLDRLISEVKMSVFWDSGVRRTKPTFNRGGYKEADWDCYERLRDDLVEGVQVLQPRAESFFRYANRNADDSTGGDGLHILSPSDGLINKAIQSENMNDGSYVLLFKSAGGNMIFAGDAHDNTWEHIIENYANEVSNCKFLLAPHHGRNSGASFEYLDVLKPELTLFGNAKSDHLAYQQWNQRNLKFHTQNQCGNVVVDTSSGDLALYIENEKYARASQFSTYQDSVSQYYYLDRI